MVVMGQLADSKAVETNRAKRPLGVWILTIYALVFVGILSLVIGIHILISDEGD
jgi:hypothetical protein